VDSDCYIVICRFKHWDVNNEQLHEEWYSEKLQDPHLLSWMFKEFNALVPSTKLFLNDFMVYANGLMTQVGIQTEIDAKFIGIMHRLVAVLQTADAKAAE
jgi:GH35 family endo-1,4-beta-xylanase